MQSERFKLSLVLKIHPYAKVKKIIRDIGYNAHYLHADSGVRDRLDALFQRSVHDRFADGRHVRADEQPLERDKRAAWLVVGIQDVETEQSERLTHAAHQDEIELLALRAPGAGRRRR